MVTLLDFATDKRILKLLVKERVKCCAHNKRRKKHSLDKESDLYQLPMQQQLSRLMPPRYSWLRLAKRVEESHGSKQNLERALLATIKRDIKLQQNGQSIAYLVELTDFISRLKARLSADNLSFATPTFVPAIKSAERLENGSYRVVCRPLSVFKKLDDKIIQSLTANYVKCFFDRYLHPNILSYRSARLQGDKRNYVPSFNDGVKLVNKFRTSHKDAAIYVSDCDIKKFYDVIPHSVVVESFERLLDKSDLDAVGREQLLKVLRASLNSYDSYTNVWLEAQEHPAVYHKVKAKYARRNLEVECVLDFPEEWLEQRRQTNIKTGIAQGGALSCMIANIVLNDIDQAAFGPRDKDTLLVRYCDDMILLSTDYDKCKQLMTKYTQVLTEHGLYYHDFTEVVTTKQTDEPTKTMHGYWSIKSHSPYLWNDGEGNSNRYLGLLGYEMQRNGNLRLRKKSFAACKDKLKRAYYMLLAELKKNELPPEQLQRHIDEVYRNILSFAHYSALDMERFTNSAQYRELIKVRNRLKNKLLKTKE